MKITPKELYNFLNGTIPFDTQEKWDNSGLLIDSGAQSEKILLCLDVTHQAASYAAENNFKIIVSHHPVIFREIKSISHDDVIYSLIKNDISVISLHTNFDKYSTGTSFAICEALGLKNPCPQPQIGITAELPRALSSKCLAEHCRKTFESVGFTLGEKTVKKVFICAGSAGGMMQEILQSGADCLVCGECKYHDSLDLQQRSVATITLGHDNSEKISLDRLKKLIEEKYENLQTEVIIPPSLTEYI